MAQTSALSVGLSATVNGRSAEATIWKGVPAVLAATLILERGERATVALAEGSWPTAVTWTVNGSAPAAEWTLEPVAVATDPVRLVPLGMITAVWLLSAEQTAALPNGEYTILSRIDTRGKAAGGAWSGEQVSRAVTVMVAADPETPVAEDEIQKVRLRAGYQIAKGNAPAGIEVLQEALGRYPDDLSLLGDLAEAQEDAGQLQEALGSVRRALALFRARYPDSDHPPRDLLAIRRRLLNKVEPQQ